MSITKIEATIRCDGCNKPFTLTLDRAATMQWSGYTDLDDYVWDLVRGPNQEYGLHTSVQGDHLLCVACTKFIDDEFDELTPTRDQVCDALNKRAGV